MIWIDNARILAIFAVVLLHVAGGFVVFSTLGSVDWWFGNLYDASMRWCVPVFVMISGALLLGTSKDEPISLFYRKRAMRVLIPTLSWSILFLLWVAYNKIIAGETVSIVGLIKMLLLGKAYFHLWFLYMILCLYLFTPFLRKIVRQSSKKELLLFVFICFAFSTADYSFDMLVSGKQDLFVNWFLYYVPYFVCGYLIKEDKNVYPPVLLWAVFLVSVVFTALACYMLAVASEITTGLYFYNYLSINVIIMSVSMMYLLKSINKPLAGTGFNKTLASLSFGIYLVHPVVLETIVDLGYGADRFNPVYAVPVSALVIFVCSLLIVWSLSRVPYLRRTI